MKLQHLCNTNRELACRKCYSRYKRQWINVPRLFVRAYCTTIEAATTETATSAAAATLPFRYRIHAYGNCHKQQHTHVHNLTMLNVQICSLLFLWHYLLRLIFWEMIIPLYSFVFVCAGACSVLLHIDKMLNVVAYFSCWNSGVLLNFNIV